MANGNDPTYRRIPYLVRVRLRRLGTLCAHGCAAVAHAAHAEIGRIHRKYRLSRPARVRAWLGDVAKAGVRKVTPHQLHKPLGVQKQAPQQARGRTADIPLADLPKRGFTPEHGFNQTKAQLKERARGSGQPQPAGRQGGDGMEHLRGLWQGYHSGTYGARGSQQPQARRSGQPAARQPDAMQQATETMRRAHQQPQGARSPGRPGQTSPFTEHRPSAPSQGAPESETQRAVRDINNVFARHYPDVQPMPEPRGQDGARSAQQPSHDGPAQRKRAADNARWHEVTKAARREDAQAGRPGGPDGPPPPTQAERVSREAARASRDIQNQNTPPERVGRAQAPPLPGDPEARLQPGEKRHWARLPKRGEDAPARTRTSRFRSRTTA